MAIICNKRYSTKKFTWIPDEQTFVAEASDLDRRHPFGRVYDDACDEGLVLVSHKTGKEIVFAIENVERDREGDLTSWVLKPVGKTPKHLQSIRVTVFND